MPISAEELQYNQLRDRYLLDKTSLSNEEVDRLRNLSRLKKSEEKLPAIESSASLTEDSPLAFAGISAKWVT